MGKMKLNYESREKLRSEVSAYLAGSGLPNGKRIKLDKETLENLLFEEIVINPTKKVVVKLPVFSGDCLQYIDLSEVSFEDVSWGLLGKNDSDYFGVLSTLVLENGADRSAIARINNLREVVQNRKGEDRYAVKYTFTNAGIDFSKSFEAKHGNCVNISSCFFYGRDDENIMPNSVDRVVKLNIADSSVDIAIPKSIKLTAVNSDLHYISLLSRRIDAYDYIQGSHEALGGCNLDGTGISIELVVGKFKQAKQAKQLLVKLRFAYKNKWRGCYINNKLDCSQRESAAIKDERRQEYDVYESDYIKRVLGIIEEQTNNTK